MLDTIDMYFISLRAMAYNPKWISCKVANILCDCLVMSLKWLAAHARGYIRA